VAEAVRLELSALALTDHNGFYGVVRFAEAARALGLPTVFGAEVTLSPAGPRTGEPDPAGAHLVVLAKNPEGYARLAAVLADAHLAGGEKGRPLLSLDQLGERHGGDWLVLTGCRKGTVPGALLASGPSAARRELAASSGLRDGRRRRRAVGPRRPARHGAQRRAGPARCRGRGPTVATNNVHYATPAGYRLATTLAAVRARRPLAELEGWLPSGRQRASARVTSSAGGSPAGPARWTRRPSSGRPVPSTCGWWRPSCPTSRSPRGSTSAATCATWSTRGPGPLRPEG